MAWTVGSVMQSVKDQLSSRMSNIQSPGLELRSRPYPVRDPFNRAPFLSVVFQTCGPVLHQITGVMVSHKAFHGFCAGGVVVGIYKGKGVCMQEMEGSAGVKC